jgi:hypothetical protein
MRRGDDMFSEQYSEEYQICIWKAGEVVPAGTYALIPTNGERGLPGREKEGIILAI